MDKSTKEALIKAIDKVIEQYEREEKSICKLYNVEKDYEDKWHLISRAFRSFRNALMYMEDD